MTLDVEFVRPDLARVTRTPSTLARIVLGRQTEDRYAVRSTVGGCWLWDQTGRMVREPDVIEALHAEMERVRVVELDAIRCRCAIEPRDWDAVGRDFAAVIDPDIKPEDAS